MCRPSRNTELLLVLQITGTSLLTNHSNGLELPLVQRRLCKYVKRRPFARARLRSRLLHRLLSLLSCLPNLLDHPLYHISELAQTAGIGQRYY